MDTLTEWMNKIEKVYPHISRPVVLNLACVVGGKAVMNIAPSGCGKSLIMDIVLSKINDKEHTPYKPDSITKSAFRHIANELSGTKRVIAVDDAAKIDTKYSLISTIVTLTELCYSHFIQKATYHMNFEVVGFKGSALINIQPSVLKRVAKDASFEASVKDKCIRYYHFYRPTAPKPRDKIKEIDEIHFDLNGKAKFNPDLVDTQEYKIIRDRFRVQFSLARALEHLVDLSKGIAVLRGKNEVDRNDLRLLKWITKGMEIEKYVIRKEELEGEREVDTDIINLFVEVITYGEGVHLDVICQDYEVSDQTVRNIVMRNHNIFYIHENRLYLTPEGKKIVEVIK